MISIQQIEYYLPKTKFKIKDKYKAINETFLINKIGATSLPRISKKENVVDICIKVAKKINLKKYKNKIKSVILCTQNPEFNGLPHNSSIIHNKLDLNDDAACFDISQGCAGYLYGMVSASSFLKKGQYALLFTCDPYSKIIKPKDFNTDILFGDAATVTLLKKDEGPKKLIESQFYSFGKEYNAIINKNGLNMNGKKVMKFCTSVVPEKIKEFLKNNNLDIKSIDQFYFHQGSKHIIDQLSHRLQIPKKSYPPYIKNLGNTVSSTLPILMKKYNYKKKIKFLFLVLVLDCQFQLDL